MTAQAGNLFLLEDLENPSRTMDLANTDVSALHTVADWIKTFVVRPNKELGRAGPVCPFVSVALDHRTLWLAAEHIADLRPPDVVQLMSGYKRLLLRAQPVAGDDAIYKAIVVVLPDLSADRLEHDMDDAQLEDFKRRSYVEDGIVLGAFHERNDGSAVRNRQFQPFRSPVPFLLLRPAVVGDWVFFLDNEEWLGLWAHRFGESAVLALAEQLRRTDWRRLAS